MKRRPHRPSAAGVSLDIIIGGFGDRLFGCARRYAASFGNAHPEREVVYLTQNRRRQLRALAEAAGEREVNLIGHSWGAADASWLVRNVPRRWGAVIGVDGVAKPGPWRPCTPNARAVVSVRGTGSEGRLADGNLTARLGRGLGHAFPEAFRCERTLRIDAPFAHYDMSRMMRWRGESGTSAEDVLLACRL